jgi:chemotaxis receptor (MCP) glutamine deamidase CheD
MPAYAFFQGKYMPLSEAKIGVMTHAFLRASEGTGTRNRNKYFSSAQKLTISECMREAR